MAPEVHLQAGKTIRCRWIWFFVGGLLLFLIFSIAPSASAQAENPSPYRWQVFAQIGGTFTTDVAGTTLVTFIEPPGVFPLTERKSFSKSHRFFAGVRLGLTPKDQVEVSYSYNPTDMSAFFIGFPLTSGLPAVRPFEVYTVSFNYVRNLPRKGRIQPFLTGGAGFVAFVGILGTEYRPAANLGVGIDVGLTRCVALRFEQRAFFSGMPQRIFVVNPSAFDIRGTSITFVPSVGLVLRF